MTISDFEGDELVSSIKKEARILNSMVEEIEEEFKQKGKRTGPHDYYRSKGLFFDPRKYCQEVNSRVRLQNEKILKLLKERFPWAPIDQAWADHEFLLPAQFTNSYWGTESASFFGPIYRIHYLLNLSKDDQLPSELYKPVYVCAARILHLFRKEFNLADVSDYDSRVLKEALAFAEKRRWIAPKGNTSYRVSEYPMIEISCPTCSNKVYAHEEDCPNCSFYIPNLALRRKKKLKIPGKWYQWSERDGEWLAYFKYIPSTIAGDIQTGDLDGVSWNVNVIRPVEDAIHSLDDEKVVRRLPNLEQDAMYYTSMLTYLHDRNDQYYSVSAPSAEELRRILASVVERIRIAAEREFDGSIGTKTLEKSEFLDDFMREAMRFFIPPLDRHPASELSIEPRLTVCSRCGAEMPTRAKFCGKCGEKLG